jgi:hypothetical protein
MENNLPHVGPDGQVLFYERRSNTVVIAHPNSPEDSTIFRPTGGESYVIDQLKDYARRQQK